MNPYASPRTRARTQTRDGVRSPWRFFICTLFFYPVWFFVGGLFSISGSEEGMAVDVGLLTAVVGSSLVTFLMGVVGALGMSAGRSDRRVASSSDRIGS